MREMMEIRGFSENTINLYITQIIKLAEYFNKPPQTLELQNLQSYQVYLVHDKKVSWSTFNQAVCAMRFF